MSDVENDEGYRPTDPEAPFTGHAVHNKILRFTSVTQISMFDAKSEGCPRKWVFRYVLGRKLAKAKHFKDGENFAKQLEQYLKTGEDVLPPTLRPAKKYFPSPGADLEVEQKFASGPNGKGKDIEKAIAAREQLVAIRTSAGDGEQIADVLRQDIKKYAGLVIHDVPIDGAADVRHTRGVFVDEDGSLRGEVPGMIVVETGDLKTMSRIHPEKIHSGPNAGTILPSYAKTAAQICEDVQMLSYGVYAARKYPDSTHQRLSHYIANKKKREAVKRTGLISNAQLFERFERIENLVLEMEQHAGCERIEDVEPNTSACDSYTHVDPTDPFGKKIIPGCGYRYFCPLSGMQVGPDLNVFGNFQEKKMGTSAFDQLNAPPPPPTNGTSAQPFDPATYAAQVEAEKAKLASSQSMLLPPGSQFCNHCGQPLTAQNTSTLPTGAVKHIGCQAQVIAQPPPPPPPPVMAQPTPPPPPMVTAPNAAFQSAAAEAMRSAITNIEGAVGVKPPDAPVADWVSQAKPLPMEQIQQVEDPELKAKLLLHHELWHKREAERQAQEALTNPQQAAQETVWCPRSTQKVVITTAMALAKKFVCECGKSYSMGTLKPIEENGQSVSVIPKHKPVNKKEVTPQITASPAQMTLPPAPPPPPPTVLPIESGRTSVTDPPIANPPRADVPPSPPPPPVVSAPPDPPPPPTVMETGRTSSQQENMANPPRKWPENVPLPPSVVGESTAMIEQLFGKETAQQAANPIASQPLPVDHAMNAVQYATAKIAKAIIDALKPIAEGK